MPTLPDDWLDPATPEDVVVRDRNVPRIEDPTLGEPLGAADPARPAPPAAPVHALATVGDSLTHGLTSGAVFRTDLSWPAQLARAVAAPSFAVPAYGGPLDGLPLNLEATLRGLQERFGTELSPFEKLAVLPVLHGLLDGNEDYWERGEGSAPPRTDVPYENLGIYGWDLRDALSSTTQRAAELASRPSTDTLLGAKPEHDNDLAAWSVLAPYGASATQLGALAQLGAQGIETVVVALGANNALDAVVSKQVRWSGDGYDDLDVKARYNVWRPTHFAAELALVVEAVRAVASRRVVLATVPHVTIAPMAHGVNPEHPGAKWREGSRYFPYYTDPWIDDRRFDPRRHRHLTHAQARAIDSAIDQYNEAIADAVRAARGQGLDWYVLDLCGILDGLAYRRFAADAAAATANDWQPYALPEALADLDTRWFRSDRTGILQGGLFGLDGIHPTICGYGIVAFEALRVLQAAGAVGATATIDFEQLRATDTLVSDPPALHAALLDALTPLAERFVSRR